jgi:GntR family transcriptional regulator/MocR family aminotransferase
LTELVVVLDRSSAVAIHRQLYESIRTSILAMRLRPGTRLPSSRSLALQLQISRNTVLEAYEQLCAEGYLESQVGCGTFVTSGLPDDLLRARAMASASEDASRPSRPVRLSSWARRIASVPVVSADSWHVARPFYHGVPAYELFPVEVWRRISNRLWAGRPGEALLGYGDAGGHAALRQAIAAYLASSRGMSCDSNQVIVVGGSQQGLYLAAEILLDAGDRVWMEDPGYRGARTAFASAGADIVPVPVDREGLAVDEGKRRSPDARLAYVTPSHQYPLGSIMSFSRRLQLLNWASSSGAWIVEDDYDAEFRYTGRPLPALQGLDEEDCVIYLGTFSKVLFPALRLGYLVVPPQLIEPFLAARSLMDRHRPLMDQAVLAEFLTGGHFERHLRRTRTAYQHRRDLLVDRLETALPGVLDIEPGPVGMHLVARLPEGISDAALSDALAEEGISAAPVSYFTTSETPERGGLLLGYTGFAEPAIKYRSKVLASVIRRAVE